MEEFQLGEAERQIHDFLWSEYCDWYIEMTKLRLRDSSSADSPLPVLVYVLNASLRLLHPFMPFVTEELWQTLQPGEDEATDGARSVTVAPYPIPSGTGIDPEAERVVEATIDIVRALRNYRAERKMEPGHRLEAAVFAGCVLDELRILAPIVEALGRVTIFDMAERTERADVSCQTVIVLADSDVAIAGASAEDQERVRSQLQKEVETTLGRLESIEQRLKDETFLAKAPAEVVERQTSLAVSLQDKLSRMESELQELG